MGENLTLVPHYVLEDWHAALREREPRALELAYELALTLPDTAEAVGLKEGTSAAENATPLVISDQVRETLRDAYEKYDALARGDFLRVDAVNPNVLAFERRTDDERLLLVHNLARIPAGKLRDYAGLAGWDILNRVEFVFPARAQLEAYEFLWLMVE